MRDLIRMFVRSIIRHKYVLAALRIIPICRVVYGTQMPVKIGKCGEVSAATEIRVTAFTESVGIENCASLIDPFVPRFEGGDILSANVRRVLFDLDRFPGSHERGCLPIANRENKVRKHGVLIDFQFPGRENLCRRGLPHNFDRWKRAEAHASIRIGRDRRWIRDYIQIRPELPYFGISRNPSLPSSEDRRS